MSEKVVKLRILHTNDHHGRYLPSSKGEYGMAARKTLIDKLRGEVKNTLLLSGGDINTGTMESDIFDAEPDFLGMKAIGYDAMAIGNHEFDNSYKVLKKQQELAGFPFLASNIFYKDKSTRPFAPYIVRELNGIRVGILGLTTKDTPPKASHTDAKKLFDFKDIIIASKPIVKKLREIEKVDFVIAVTHVGHYGSATSNGDIDLAKKVSGIDVIVGGHSQEVINAEVHNETIIVQAQDWGKYVGALDLEINVSNGIVKNSTYELLPINMKKKVKGVYQLTSEKIPADKSMIKLFAPYKKKAEKVGNAAFGSIDKKLIGDRKLVRSIQMPVAQFMGAASYEKLRFDVMVLNGGSMRSGLEAGTITRKKLHKLHPYGNTLVSVKFTAEEVFDYIAAVTVFALKPLVERDGGYPHFMGVKLEIKNNKLQKIVASDGSWSITKDVNGKVSSTKNNFILSTANFLARGGDSFPILKNHSTYYDSGFMLNGAMIDYVGKRGQIRAKDFAVSDRDILIRK